MKYLFLFKIICETSIALISFRVYNEDNMSLREIMTMAKRLDELAFYQTQGSAAAFERAELVIPGGVTANIKHFDPYPIFMVAGDGSQLIDVDGNRYIDYSLCYGALMTGHGDQRVQEATVRQLTQSGTAIFGTPHELESEMAERIKAHYPSMEKMRFTNSGTEANLLAIRLATAFTNKTKIAKFEGHYHGGLNQLLFSINPEARTAGDGLEPEIVAESNGLTDADAEGALILPFNHLAGTERLLRKYADDVAAVFIEPIQGGFIPADQVFMDGLRKLTKELGILLIFDEVKTGFRVGLGGGQALYGITPDMTTLGKVIGGGFPIGVVGGRDDVMMLSAANGNGDVFAVGSRSGKTTDIVFHSGTYNGHPVVLAAGLETLNIIESGGVLDKVHSYAGILRNGLEELYKRYGIPMKTFGVGSIFNIVMCDQVVSTYRDMWEANIQLRKEIDQELLSLGIYVKPLNRYSLSTAHTLDDVMATIAAHEEAIIRVQARRG